MVADAVQVFRRTKGLTEAVTPYCPGCTHGIAHRLVAEVLEELDVLDRTVGVASVGCATTAYEYFAVDMQQAAHGRACAVATGIKRVLSDRLVFTYQGDGDLAAIGIAETLHAALRGENFTVVFINNAIYGMTGGQMAPTTPPGMRTTTTPAGRQVGDSGHPLRVAELIAGLDGVMYVARGALHNPAQVVRARRYLKRAFELQLEGRGFTLVDLLSTCNVNWGMTPVEALRWVDERLVPLYPLGEIKVPT